MLGCKLLKTILPGTSRLANPLPELAKNFARCYSGDPETGKHSSGRVVRLKRKSTPRIYTRTGDSGNSALFTGERRPKDDVIFEALGTVDELSCNIGLCVELGTEKGHPYVDQLQRVQCLLQDIGSSIATPASSARNTHLIKTKFNSRHTKELEEWIDEYSEELPPLQNFILPGGGIASASLHVSRAVCRRTERQIATLLHQNDSDQELLKYVNRLSDFLFTIARFAAKIDGKEETIYRRTEIEEGSQYEKLGPDELWKKKVKP